MIPRRAFLIGLGLTGFVVPLPTRAQPGKLARVGYISSLPEGFMLADAWRKAFVDGLRAARMGGEPERSSSNGDMQRCAPKRRRWQWKNCFGSTST